MFNASLNKTCPSFVKRRVSCIAAESLPPVLPQSQPAVLRDPGRAGHPARARLQLPGTGRQRT